MDWAMWARVSCPRPFSASVIGVFPLYRRSRRGGVLGQAAALAVHAILVGQQPLGGGGLVDGQVSGYGGLGGVDGQACNGF